MSTPPAHADRPAAAVIPLDENLLCTTLVEPSCCAEARAHLQTYLANGGGSNRKVKGHTLLEISAINGWVEETESLLARGADIHAYHDLALRGAATRGHTDIVCLLLASGADVHANKDGALRWAAINQHRRTTERVLLGGADTRQAVNRSHASRNHQVIRTLDACAAAIPADQQTGLLKVYGKQMPALSSLVRQEQRRSNRRAP